MSGWPSWLTSHPVLQEIPSDQNYIPKVSHPTAILKMAGRFTPQHLPCFWKKKKMAENVDLLIRFVMLDT